MIYFDNSASTVPYKEVLETFTTVSSTYYANPSSLHPSGKKAEHLLLQAKKRIAALLNISGGKMVMTAGGTEGNNLAVKGAALKHRSRGNHIITTGIEHPSVYEACKDLEKQGFLITYIKPGPDGCVTSDQIEEQITDDTILVSMIHVNNETGAVQPVEQTGELLKKHRKIIFHVDHVQGVSKVPLDIEEAGIDLCTISAHKFHGLKGSGLLYVRNGIELAPLLHGGDQESGHRAGTENVAAVVSMAKALRLVLEQSETKLAYMRRLSVKLEEELANIKGVVINSPKERAPHILNLSVPGLKPEVLVQALGEKGIYVSTKSACSSKQFAPSRILTAAGCSEEIASSAIRLSFSFNNTTEEADQFVQEFKKAAASMKEVVESR